MIKALLFDFNGVIIDDEGLQMQAYQDVLRERGVEFTEDDYYASLGMDDRGFVESMYERANQTLDVDTRDAVVAAKFERWRETVDAELPLFPGIVDFVEKMSREFALGIVSMATRDEIDFVLDKSGLAGHFSTIVSTENCQACKPDPEVFRIGFRQIDAIRIAQGHLPMTHGDCLVIEDSPPGVVGARSADLQVLGVANTVSADKLRAAGAGAVATDLRDWMPESIRRVFV